MKPLSKFNIGDKVHRHHRRMMTKLGLAAAVKGAAQVQANGRLLVTLPLVDGTQITYEAHPRSEVYFTEAKFSPKPSVAVTEVTPADRAHAALNLLLGVLADAESKTAN
jgi:hypothetical protein